MGYKKFEFPWFKEHTHWRLAAGFMLKLILLNAGADQGSLPW